MFKVLLAIHILFAVFAIGPLVHAATTAGRAARKRDATSAAFTARMLKIYAYTSILVVALGAGLMSVNSPVHKGEKVAEISDLWIWLSLLLWAIGIAITLAVLVPSLAKVGRQDGLTVRITAAGNVVALIFTVIVFLMVYRPGD